jgi:hypothetical protein
MGEAKRKLVKRKESQSSCSAVQTVAGRVQVRWEAESAATPMGQLAYFIEFLTLSGLWSRWIESCPLAYTSPNAPGEGRKCWGPGCCPCWLGPSPLRARDRQSAATAVNPGLLGMRQSHLRRRPAQCALKRIPERKGLPGWMQHLIDSVAPLLDAPWILDGDTTIKPLYGHQEGALLGYNPKKAGTPLARVSHLPDGRIAPGAGRRSGPGNEHTARHAQPGLLKLLDALPPDKKPQAGTRRQRLRQRSADGRAGRARSALPVQAQALEERQAPHQQPVPPIRLDRRRPRLGRQGR